MPFYRCMPPAGSGGGGGDTRVTEINFQTNGRETTKGYFTNMCLADVPIKMTAECNNFVSMFLNLQNFNSPVPVDTTAMTNVYYASSAFTNCYNFNAEVLFPDTLNYIHAQYMFRHCYNYNQPIRYPRNILHTANATQCSIACALWNCNNFNSIVDFPESVVTSNVYGLNCMSFFSNCYNYNQKTIIKNCGIFLGGFFRQCYNLNSPVLFDERYYDMSDNYYRGWQGFLQNCNNFNAPLILPRNLSPANHTKNTNYQSFLQGCTNFSQPYLYIPIGQCMNNAFRDTGVLTNNFNLILDVVNGDDTTSAYTWFESMLYASNGMPTPWPGIKRIYRNNADAWLVTNAGGWSPVTGRYSMFGNNVNVTFTPVTNGYYNAAYNVYFLNNVSDALAEYDNWVASLNLNYNLP